MSGARRHFCSETQLDLGLPPALCNRPAKPSRAKKYDGASGQPYSVRVHDHQSVLYMTKAQVVASVTESSKRRELSAMMAQVARLDECLRVADPWPRLLAAFPELLDIQARIKSLWQSP